MCQVLRTLHITSHIIDTRDNPPVKNKYYRYDKQKTKITWHVSNMLKGGGYYWENKITYCSPVVLCRKQNGKLADSPDTWRLSIDYRKLNKEAIFHNYHMPKIEDLLHGVRRHKIIPTLDPTSGYYQIPIREEDKHKTAFVAPSGCSAFDRMSFGLSSVPCTFQRLMYHFCSQYLIYVR